MSLDNLWHHLERGLIFRRLAFGVGLWMSVDGWLWMKTLVQPPLPWQQFAAILAAITAMAVGLIKIYADHRSE